MHALRGRFQRLGRYMKSIVATGIMASPRELPQKNPGSPPAVSELEFLENHRQLVRKIRRKQGPHIFLCQDAPTQSRLELSLEEAFASNSSPL